ncbi:MAG: EF-hand domain-containing protein [Pseudomonadota bacterium]
MNVPTRPRRLLLALFAVLLITQANAQTMRADTDGDGRLSLAEFEAVSDGRVPFEDVDTNGDGFVDADEGKAFRRAARERRRDRLKAADTNGDGLLSRDEFDAVAGGRFEFDDLDSNADGVIDADERAALRRDARNRLRSRQDSSL